MNAETIRVVARKLQADFDASQDITHPGLKGTAREKGIAQDLLGHYLPKRFSVAGGQIMDWSEIPASSRILSSTTSCRRQRC